MSIAPAPPLSSSTGRIAIICPSWVGDTVMATPVYRAVRNHCPDAEIVAAVRPGLGPLLAGASWFDEVIEAPFKSIRAVWRLGKALRKREPEATILLPNSFRAGAIGRFSDAPIRIGYDRDGRGWMLTHRIPVERSATPTSTVDYYLAIGAAAIGAPIEDRRLELATTEEQEAAATRVLDDERDFLLLNPGASKLEKRWPAERFAEVADRLYESHDIKTVVTGAPSEHDVVRAVVDASDPARRHTMIDIATAGVDLGSLKAVVRRCSLMITNDTGPRHLAAAFGRPVVGLFGPTDPRWTTLPDADEMILRAEPFLPEELVADDHAQTCDIERITTCDVVAAATRFLDRSPSC